MEAKIIEALGLKANDWGMKPYGTRKGVTNLALITSFLKYEVVGRVATDLGISKDSLEHYMSRYWYSRYTDKLISESWYGYFLYKINMRRCFSCCSIQDISNFSKNLTIKRNIAYRCKSCDNMDHKIYSQQHPGVQSTASKKHYHNNKAEYIQRNIERNLQTKLATPIWANLDIIKDIYSHAEGAHVDHVIPLKGELVCGLNVETNMQYLTPEENLKKSNKFEVL